MASPETTEALRDSKVHPRGLYTVSFTEMWGRFSCYGMRALLVRFMIGAVRGGLGLTDKVATAIYGLYTAGVYLSALPGGWIADRFLGAQRSVWYGGIMIAAGQFLLLIPRPETFYLGLLCVVCGTGLLKPNISAIVGELYPEGGARRDAGFDDILLPRARRLDHLVNGPVAPVEKPCTKPDRSIVDHLGPLVGQQFSATSMRGDEAFRHGKNLRITPDGGARRFRPWRGSSGVPGTQCPRGGRSRTRNFSAFFWYNFKQSFETVQEGKRCSEPKTGMTRGSREGRRRAGKDGSSSP